MNAECLAKPGCWSGKCLVVLLVALPSSSRADSPPVPTQREETKEPPIAQDEFWSHVKDLHAGPLTFDFSGQARLRFEYDDGFGIKGYEPGGHDQLLLERIRFELSTRFWDRPRLFLQLQDAHAFFTKLRASDFPQSNPIEDTLDIRQLFIEWLKIGGSPVGFRVGRQQISYGDQRVFGPGNWGNTGRFAWDAAMLKIETESLWSDLWVGRFLQYQSSVWPDRAVDNFLTVVDYTQVQKLPFRLGLFYVLKYDASGTVAGETGTGDLLSHTMGFQADGTAMSELLDAGATFAVQFGRYGADRLLAFGANARLGVTAPVEWKPRIGGQFTWGSGDQNPADGIHGTFDGVYGGRDIFFYGYLNLFFWANLRDAEVDFSVHPHRAVTLYVEYHHLALDAPRDAWYTTGLKAYRRDVSGGSGSTLGDELDVRAVWLAWGHLELMAGYGHFFPGAFVNNTGAAAPADWGFAQAAYSW